MSTEQYGIDSTEKFGKVIKPIKGLKGIITGSTEKV